ncbi:GyrI-like domain-containing protein [Nocardioides coralli]|uniref:GyrI-like domain-containing protein n=1 Tax=Nocardioides coralli TaxID=2872154 RepID=UPI00201777D3|nr:GyrI-like domain-containing protein [Nocardioides coralli]
MKVDPKKSLDSYAARRGVFRVVEIPPLRYLMVDGHGDPNTSREYADALAALYPVAYGLKFASKRELGRDYVVPPLEALWWADDMTAFTSARDKSRWSWTAMIMTPDWVPADLVAQAVAKVAAKDRPTRLDDVRLETLEEGLSVQTLHVGPYDAEADVLAEMHDRFIPDSGLRMTGRHHEVYLSDARRVAPEKLRTILRQPVERV